MKIEKLSTIEKARKAHKYALSKISDSDLNKIIAKIDRMNDGFPSYVEYLNSFDEQFSFVMN